MLFTFTSFPRNVKFRIVQAIKARTGSFQYQQQKAIENKKE